MEERHLERQEGLQSVGQAVRAMPHIRGVWAGEEPRLVCAVRHASLGCLRAQEDGRKADRR